MTIAPVPQVGCFQSCMELLGSPTTYLLTENNLVSHTATTGCPVSSSPVPESSSGYMQIIWADVYPAAFLCPIFSALLPFPQQQLLIFTNSDFMQRTYLSEFFSKDASYPCAGVCVGKYDHVHCHRHTRSTWSFSVVILMEQIYQKSEIAKWMKHKQNFIH